MPTHVVASLLTHAKWIRDWLLCVRRPHTSSTGRVYRFDCCVIVSLSSVQVDQGYSQCPKPSCPRPPHEGMALEGLHSGGRHLPPLWDGIQGLHSGGRHRPSNYGMSSEGLHNGGRHGWARGLALGAMWHQRNTLCFAIVPPGRKSVFRAAFQPDSSRESALRPAGNRF